MELRHSGLYQSALGKLVSSQCIHAAGGDGTAGSDASAAAGGGGGGHGFQTDFSAYNEMMKREGEMAAIRQNYSSLMRKHNALRKDHQKLMGK